MKRFKFVQLRINKIQDVDLVKDSDEEHVDRQNTVILQIIDMSIIHLTDQFKCE